LKTVAVTGQIGAGKSTVCNMMCDLGASHIDADQVAREVLQPGTLQFREILNRFGDSIRNELEGIDRAKLAEHVFRDENALQDLNRIMHPEIMRRIAQRLEGLLLSGSQIALVEAALLGQVETPFWDHLVVVTAPREIRLQRLILSGMHESDASNRIRVQEIYPPSYPSSHFELDNGNGLEKTYQEVQICWKTMTGNLPAPREAFRRGNLCHE